MKEKWPLPASWEGGTTGLVEVLPACLTWGNTFNCFQGICNTNICIAGHGHGNDWRFCSRFSKTGRLFNEQDQSRDPDVQSYLYLPSHQRKGQQLSLRAWLNYELGGSSTPGKHLPLREDSLTISSVLSSALIA